MDILQQSFPPPTARKITSKDDCLSLYDRYGSLAYGIILRIIPEPKLAQAVLVDLFTSPEVKSYTESSLQVSSKLIQLARSKALKARPANLIKSPTASPATTGDLNKHAFDLSFYEGYSIQEIAQKLHLSPANVLKMIAIYLKQRTSK